MNKTIDEAVSGHPAAEAELEQLRNRVGQLQDQLSGGGEVMSDDKMREAFEEWFRSEGYSFEASADMDDMWCCWQAALSQQPESERVADFNLKCAMVDCIRIVAAVAYPDTREVARYENFARRKLRQLEELARSGYDSPQPSAQVPEDWRVAVQEFVNRCERGEVRSKRTYTKFKALLTAAPSIAEKREPMPYLLAKHGMWYAHNDCGYVSRAEMAELYTKEYAEKYASGHDEVKAVPLSDIISSPENLQPYIDRINRMHRALSCLQRPEPPEVQS